MTPSFSDDAITFTQETSLSLVVLHLLELVLQSLELCTSNARRAQCRAISSNIRRILLIKENVTNRRECLHVTDSNVHMLLAFGLVN